MLSANNMLTTGGRRQRQRGTVRVSEPANGFFIAGSSIIAMNGVYIRKNAPRVSKESTDPGIVLYYEHEDGLWHMALKELSNIPDEESEDDEDDYFYRAARKRRPEHEWVFMDEFGKDRFSHEGDTIVPGAGVRWKHVHTHVDSSVTEGANTGDADITAIATIAPDDEDELPWQVIAILDWQTVQELVWSSEYRKQKVRDAKMGKTAKKPARASLEASFAAGNCWLFRVIAPDGADLYMSPDDTGANSEVGHVECGQYLRGQELSPEGEWLRLDKREDVFVTQRGRMRFQQSRQERHFCDDDSDEDNEDCDGEQYRYFNADYSQREVWVRVWTKGWGASGKCPLLEEVTPTESAVMEDDKTEDDASPGCAGENISTEDLFDRPFVPRVEVSPTPDEVVPDPPPLCDGASDEASDEALHPPTEEEAVRGVPVGSAVMVSGLTTRAGMAYNGINGVVIGQIEEASGRQPVRLNAPFR